MARGAIPSLKSLRMCMPSSMTIFTLSFDLLVEPDEFFV
jgi:hypothetical protein